MIRVKREALAKADIELAEQTIWPCRLCGSLGPKLHLTDCARRIARADIIHRTRDRQPRQLSP